MNEKLMSKLDFDMIESCFPDGGYQTEDGHIAVSAQWLHDFAYAIERTLLAAAQNAAGRGGVADADAETPDTDAKLLELSYVVTPEHDNRLARLIEFVKQMERDRDVMASLRHAECTRANIYYARIESLVRENARLDVENSRLRHDTLLTDANHVRELHAALSDANVRLESAEARLREGK